MFQLKKSMENTVKGLLNHKNIEENTSKTRSWSFSSHFLRKLGDPIELEESTVKGVIKRRWKENWKK
jgi:hypothetical protein